MNYYKEEFMRNHLYLCMFLSVEAFCIKPILIRSNEFLDFPDKPSISPRERYISRAKYYISGSHLYLLGKFLPNNNINLYVYDLNSLKLKKTYEINLSSEKISLSSGIYVIQDKFILASDAYQLHKPLYVFDLASGSINKYFYQDDLGKDISIYGLSVVHNEVFIFNFDNEPKRTLIKIDPFTMKPLSVKSGFESIDPEGTLGDYVYFSGWHETEALIFQQNIWSGIVKYFNKKNYDCYTISRLIDGLLYFKPLDGWDYSCKDYAGDWGGDSISFFDPQNLTITKVTSDTDDIAWNVLIYGIEFNKNTYFNIGTCPGKDLYCLNQVKF